MPATCDWANALWLQQHSENAFFGTPPWIMKKIFRLTWMLRSWFGPWDLALHGASIRSWSTRINRKEQQHQSKGKIYFTFQLANKYLYDLNFCLSFLECWARICCIFVREDKNWERNQIWIRVFVDGWLNLCKNLTTAKLLKPQLCWGPLVYD